MPFEEKMSWVSVVVTVVVATFYFWTTLGQLAEVPAAEIAYQPALLISMGAAVVLMVMGAIAMAAGSAIKAELTASGSADDIDRRDERDVSIRRRGDVVGFYVASVGAFGVLGLTMLEYDYFWIASALYLTFVLASLASDVVKIHAYRRGL